MPPTNVETLPRALSDQEVEFIIIGGAAAVLHGSACVTADLDICYSREKENLKRLAAALAPFNHRRTILLDQAVLSSANLSVFF